MKTIDIPIAGMTCQNCVRHVQEALRSVPGVQSADVSLASNRATVQFSNGAVQRSQLVAAVKSAGYDVPDQPPPPRAPLVTLELTPPKVVRNDEPAAETPRSEPTAERTVLAIEGMHCASCVTRVEDALTRTPGVVSARVNLATNQATVRYEPGQVAAPALLAAVERSGYPPSLSRATTCNRSPTIPISARRAGGGQDFCFRSRCSCRSSPSTLLRTIRS